MDGHYFPSYFHFIRYRMGMRLRTYILAANDNDNVLCERTALKGSV
jgi:hypothetical protein